MRNSLRVPLAVAFCLALRAANADVWHVEYVAPPGIDPSWLHDEAGSTKSGSGGFKLEFDVYAGRDSSGRYLVVPHIMFDSTAYLSGKANATIQYLIFADKYRAAVLVAVVPNPNSRVQKQAFVCDDEHPAALAQEVSAVPSLVFQDPSWPPKVFAKKQAPPNSKFSHRFQNGKIVVTTIGGRIMLETYSLSSDKTSLVIRDHRGIVSTWRRTKTGKAGAFTLNDFVPPDTVVLDARTNDGTMESYRWRGQFREEPPIPDAFDLSALARMSAPARPNQLVLALAVAAALGSTWAVRKHVRSKKVTPKL